jgi:2',3'-cyclic-nucleotide 2'-phosphodiesterase (5'-nucleotidase family)
MVNLKKYNRFLKLFVIFLSFSVIASCRTKEVHLTKIEGKQIHITAEEDQVAEIENFIRPYRQNINKDLDSVLAYCPETLDKKTINWQTTIGNLMADVTLAKGNKVFQARANKNMVICFLNHGGIRAILPKGNITARNAYKIMPFENNLVVVTLKGEQVLDILNYFISEKQAHPISGMTFVIDKNNLPKNILVQGKIFDVKKSYYVGTNDYLANGGDNMNFFKKAIATYDLDYKLRNILIDYFTENDTIRSIQDNRITVE